MVLEVLEETPVSEPTELLPPLPVEDSQAALYPTALFPPTQSSLWDTPGFTLNGFHPYSTTGNPFSQPKQLQKQAPQQQFSDLPSFRPSNFLYRKQEVVKKAPKPFSISGHTEVRPDGVIVAIYSNIQVYEYYVADVAVMRRFEDSWVNATHILKAADVDKGRRSKILDKELSGSQYEKIQGGYGRYQGTWVPLETAKQLARDFGVEDALAPLLDIP